MKPSGPECAFNELKPVSVNFSEIRGQLKKMYDKQGVETLVGALFTTKGILVHLFSPRMNQDVALLVPATDISLVVAEVIEGLAAL